MVGIFNLQNSHLLTLSLPTEEVFQVNGQNRLVANLPVVDFHSQPREMLTPKYDIRNFRFFFQYIDFLSLLGKFEPHCLPAKRIFQSAVIRESSDKQLVLRIVNALPFIHQPDRVAQRRVKCQQLIGYINTREKIRCFFTRVVTAFLWARNP